MAAWKEWTLGVHSHFPNTTSIKHLHLLFPYASKSSFSCFRLPKMSTLYLILGESANLQKERFRSYGCSCGDIRIFDDISDYLNEGNIGEKSIRSSQDVNEQKDMIEGPYSHLANSSLQYGLLMENIEEIEDMLAGRDLDRLEREILVHVRRLGALKLFHACLSSTLSTPPIVDQNIHLKIGHNSSEHSIGRCENKTIVCTGRKEKRKLRRSRALTKATKMSAVSSSSLRISARVKTPSFLIQSGLSSSNDFSNTKKTRAVIARNEAEMSKGVKEFANLERTRVQLEEVTGKPTSYARWAEAAGIDQKTLQQHLQFGWYCRDRLIRSTRSLVIYLAKNYRGKGIAFDDLLQAGNAGVLKGAERFDETKGYRFSTYVQYWIKKAILALVERHSRGIQIPVRMEKAISKIQNARNSLFNQVGRHPRDDELAAFTGLSAAKVRAASNCARIIGSIDKEIGVGWRTKFTEVTPDTSIAPTEEAVTRELMKREIFDILEDLHPNEKQVLVHRFGFEDGSCKSLKEIGRICKVTKEWIRKIEKRALEKLSKEVMQREMKHYL